MSESFHETDRPEKKSVRYVDIDERSDGQRLDNFLLRELKGAPRSLIYKILRKGEVRVNKKRAKPMQKLKLGDSVRIPPVKIDLENASDKPSESLQSLLNSSIIFEDDYLLVLNKPSGLAVHGGSGLSTGLIESLRAMRPEQKYLELVHRLDRETSGCLILAKKRSALVALHEMLREGQVTKTYQALVMGKWPKSISKVDAPLQKNTLSSGERMVRVDESGKQAVTYFAVSKQYKQAALLDVDLDTGRTHQIRVHTQLAGHAILGDAKYLSQEGKKLSKTIGIKRLFLHAKKLEFRHPESKEKLLIESPLPKDLSDVLIRLEN